MRTFRSIAPPAPPRGDADPLAAAVTIGARLVRDAVAYRAQCNWIGVDTAAAHGLGRYRPVHRALGPALGDGTAGVALFLAQLHTASPDPAVRRTALGAIGQALAHADRVAPAAARGLYAGRLGIAYAAARCGVLLGEERLLRRASEIARGRWLTETAPGGSDLATGTAGAIAGLLALSRLLGDDRLAQRAGALGGELAQAARRDRHGWSWPAPAARQYHGLCGMAGGAAGVAWALLELFAATGERGHREAAERALDYEGHWFDEQQGDWPDLRGVRRGERRGTFRSPYPATWSHGAPGIALSRLRAWEILGDERRRTEAVVALGTTAARVERALLAHGEDFTLGHGLAGSADVLLLGARLTADPDPEAAAARVALARRTGDIGIGRHAASIDGWPCGMPPGQTPELLTGHAGIGLFYLRLHDATVPSALLLASA